MVCIFWLNIYRSFNCKYISFVFFFALHFCLGPDSLSQLELDSLLPWIQSVLGNKVKNVKATSQLESHPCVITVDDMTAARHFIKTQLKQMDEEMLFSVLQPQLELNPK